MTNQQQYLSLQFQQSTGGASGRLYSRGDRQQAARCWVVLQCYMYVLLSSFVFFCFIFLSTVLIIKGVRESILSVGKSRARDPTQNPGVPSVSNAGVIGGVVHLAAVLRVAHVRLRRAVKHAVQRSVPAPRDLPERLAMKVRPRPVRVPSARLRQPIAALRAAAKLFRTSRRNFGSCSFLVGREHHTQAAALDGEARRRIPERHGKLHLKTLLCTRDSRTPLYFKSRKRKEKNSIGNWQLEASSKFEVFLIIHTKSAGAGRRMLPLLAACCYIA